MRIPGRARQFCSRLLTPRIRSRRGGSPRGLGSRRLDGDVQMIAAQGASPSCKTGQGDRTLTSRNISKDVWRWGRIRPLRLGLPASTSIGCPTENAAFIARGGGLRGSVTERQVPRFRDAHCNQPALSCRRRSHLPHASMRLPHVCLLALLALGVAPTAQAAKRSSRNATFDNS